MLNFLLTNPVTRFFYPRVIPGDVVSEIYVKSFRWTFFTMLILAWAVYYVFNANSPFVVDFMNAFGNFLSTITGREQQRIEDPEVNGFFLVVMAIPPTFFFFKNIKKIPPDVCDLDFKSLFLLIFTFAIFVVLGTLITATGRIFEKNPDFSLASFVFLLFFAYIYGLMSVNFARFLLPVSVLFGWRITNKSLFNPVRPRYKPKTKD